MDSLHPYSFQQRKRFIPSVFEREINLSPPPSYPQPKRRSRNTGNVNSRRKLNYSPTNRNDAIFDSPPNRKDAMFEFYDCFQERNGYSQKNLYVDNDYNRNVFTDHQKTIYTQNDYQKNEFTQNNYQRNVFTENNHPESLTRTAREKEHDAVIKEIFEDASDNSPSNNKENTGENLDFNTADDILPPCFNTLMHQPQHHSPLAVSPEMNLLKVGSPELENLFSSQEEEIIFKEHLDPNCSSTTQHLDPNCSSTKYSSNSPIISEQDLQFITETNKQLESLLPKKHKLSTEQLFDSDSEFQNTFMESFEQVAPLTSVDEFNQSNNNNTKLPTNEMEEIYSNIKLEELSNDSYYEQDINNSDSSFYDIIEEHVRNKKSKNSEIQLKAEIAKRYSEEDQALIKRFISGNQLSLPPIDYELQEVIKRERKKLKNRVAASKCRRKKLEREAQLELKVSHLKEQSVELSSVAHSLRKEATDLKHRIIEHMNAGCSLEFRPQAMRQHHNSYYM